MIIDAERQARMLPHGVWEQVETKSCTKLIISQLDCEKQPFLSEMLGGSHIFEFIYCISTLLFAVS